MRSIEIDDTGPDDTRPEDTRPEDTRPDDTGPDDTKPKSGDTRARDEQAGSATPKNTEAQNSRPPAPPALPDPSEARLEALRRLVPEGRLARSDHFLLASRLDPARARRLLAILERLVTRLVAELPGPERGRTPRLTGARLELVIFPSQKAFRAFAFEQAFTMMNGDGFFSPVDERSYFYDIDHSHAARRAAGQLAADRERLTALDAAIARERSGARRTHLRRRRRRLARDIRATAERRLALLHDCEAMTAVHEVTHHVLARLALLPASTELPTWLRESHAVAWEELALRGPSAAFTRPPADHNRLRLGRLALARRDGETRPPLAKLIGTSESLFGTGGATAYARLWLLMHEIHVGDPETFGPAFRTFQTRMAAAVERHDAAGTTISDAERVRLFESCFGLSCADLEARLDKLERRLAPDLDR